MKWWVSWYDTNRSDFELHSPWWVSGSRVADGAYTICAAVQAPNAEAAKKVIESSYDDPNIAANLEWRFVHERGDDWSPFCDRFPREEWMQWPTEPAGPAQENDRC